MKDDQQTLAQLRSNWKDAVANAKKAWLELHEFSKRTGQAEALNIDFPSDFKESLEKAGLQLEVGKNGIQELVDNVFPADQQQEIGESASRMIKEIFGDVVKDMPSDPQEREQWANNLHRQFFADEEAIKDKERKEEIRNTVREAIAQRLREKGITPAEDFNQ